MSAPNYLPEIAWSFLKLGCISFGGPVAHLGYLREECVVKRHWLDDAIYSDLVALCQFLPGPASSQLVFALGRHRGGLQGAVLASACFTLPSAVLMILFAYGVSMLGNLQSTGWLHGLKLAAVAVVAQAVWGMGRKLCPDAARFSMAVIVAAAVLLLQGALAQVGAIAAGGVLGWWIYRRDLAAPPIVAHKSETVKRSSRSWAAGALLLAVGLLAVLPMLTAALGGRGLALFDSFYRAGALVFGGGHVVLPLLRQEVVPAGWLSDNAFLAGYGAAQAVPGPLFTFAAYLGTAIQGGPHAWLGGVWCLLAVFLPGWLLIGGALPFWNRLRTKAGVQAAMRGANAAVVGVLLAALYNPVWREGVHGPSDVAAVLL
ncbi:MAG: chromate efflux transporter, partial [Verrucomicrobiaceae bacterium]